MFLFDFTMNSFYAQNTIDFQNALVSNGLSIIFFSIFFFSYVYKSRCCSCCRCNSGKIVLDLIKHTYTILAKEWQFPVHLEYATVSITPLQTMCWCILNLVLLWMSINCDICGILTMVLLWLLFEQRHVIRHVRYETWNIKCKTPNEFCV